MDTPTLGISALQGILVHSVSVSGPAAETQQRLFMVRSMLKSKTLFTGMRLTFVIDIIREVRLA
jgi:hypothetical protein